MKILRGSVNSRKFRTFEQILLVLQFVPLLVPQSQCAKILFFHNIASYSHRVPTYALAEALVDKGHDVTYISPFHPRPPINPKITEIVPERFAKAMGAFLDNDLDINLSINKQLPRIVHGFYDLALNLCEELLQSPEFQAFLANTTHLDLIIMDNCMAECAIGMVHKYRAKFAYFNVAIHLPNEHDFYGIAPESSSIPEMEIDTPQTPMSLWERIGNTLVSIHFRYEHYKYMLRLDQLIRRHMKETEDMPFADDLARNASLVFYTGDVVTDYPRSHPPLVVNIAGIHCKPESHPLPEDMEWFVGNSTDGFVFISLGSFVVSSNMPDYLKEMFYETIESFPKLRFLWKWSGEFPKKIPSNLYLAKWFPQTDVLAHPKIKGFVTQAGRPSTFESLCAAVPMTAIPVISDQFLNANRINKVGGNVLLDFSTITQEKFVSAIQQMAYGSRMKKRMERLRDILFDQPMSPRERGIWWTEYVLRQPNTVHLKPASFDQYWFQRRMVDVWFLLFMIILISALALSAICVGTCKVLLKLMNYSKTRKQKRD